MSALSPGRESAKVFPANGYDRSESAVFGIFRQGQVFSEQGAAVDLARQGQSVGIDNEEAVQERLLVSKKVREIVS